MSDNEHQLPPFEEKRDPWIEEGEVKQPPGGEEKNSSDTELAWQRNLINRLAFAALTEQRKTRRWGIFFKSVFVVYFLVLLFLLPGDWSGEKIGAGNHSALVEIQGIIAENSAASADVVVKSLRAAFKDTKTKGIILRINSPGGSPVQAGYITDEIVRLRDKYPDIPLYAVISDICASGGYYVASAADEIYADKASIVGSIGVLMDSFGFVEAMKKLGIERRLLTAGEHKGLLDPFSPTQHEDVMHIKGLLTNIHKQFIAAVKQGRGSRLKESLELFSGLVWTGEQSIELGLVDGLGSSSYVARELIGEEKIVDFTTRPSFFDRFADRIGVALANTINSSLRLVFSGLR